MPPHDMACISAQVMTLRFSEPPAGNFNDVVSKFSLGGFQAAAHRKGSDSEAASFGLRTGSSELVHILGGPPNMNFIECVLIHRHLHIGQREYWVMIWYVNIH